jgi:hypothetical protein
MFQKNESTPDRVIRLVVGAGLVVLSLAALGLTSGSVLGIIAAVVGAVLLFTAVTGTCLLYKLFGMNTAK